MIEIAPELAVDNRRIVLEHTSGAFKGIHSICGLRRELDGALPEFLPDVEMHDHRGPASLVAVKRTYYLYREIFMPEMQHGKTFSGEQR